MQNLQVVASLVDRKRRRTHGDAAGKPASTSPESAPAAASAAYEHLPPDSVKRLQSALQDWATWHAGRYPEVSPLAPSLLPLPPLPAEPRRALPRPQAPR